MSALSQTYNDCYMVQMTISQDFLVTVIIYHCQEITLGPAPQVLKIENLDLRVIKRLISKRYTQLSEAEKREVQSRIDILGGEYAVLPNAAELIKYLHGLLKQHGYSTQESRSRVQGWVAPLKSHEN